MDTCTMEYYSAIKKSEILPCMDLEGISEVNQRKTNIVWFHLYVESKTQRINTIKKDSQMSRTKYWLLTGWGAR